MKVLILITLFIPPLFAQTYSTATERSIIENRSYDDIKTLMQLARDPSIDPENKKKVLELGFHFLRSEVSKKFSLPHDQLPQAFQDNKNIRNFLEKGKIQEVFTEVSLLDKYIRGVDIFKQCEDFYFKNAPLKRNLPISEDVFRNMASSCTIEEGAYLHSYRTWEFKHADGRRETVSLPNFTLASNIEDILNVTYRSQIEKYLNPVGKEKATGYPMLPTLEEFKKQFPNKSFDEEMKLAVKTKTRAEIYERIMTNSMRTMVMLNHLGGHDKNGTKARAMATDMIAKICKHCSPQMENEIVNRSLNALKSDLDGQFKELLPMNPAKLAVSLCKDLKENFYNHDVYSSNYLATEEVKGSDQISKMSEGQRQMFKNKIKAENLGILQKMARKKNGGVLFLTNALTKLDEHERPHQTKLKCIPGSENHDEQIVRAATVEAKGNIVKYLNSLHSTVNPANTTEEQLDEDLRYLVDSNPTASGQALAVVEESAQTVCIAIYSREWKKKKKKQLEEMAFWGANIVGIGLTLTGVGASVGLPLLASAEGLGILTTVNGVRLAAMAGGAAATAVKVGIRYSQTNEADELKQIYHQAYNTQEGNILLKQREEEELRNYQALKFEFIIQALILPMDLIDVADSLKIYGGMKAVTARFRSLMTAKEKMKVPKNLERNFIVLGMANKYFNPKNISDIKIGSEKILKNLMLKPTLTSEEMTQARAAYLLIRTLGYSVNVTGINKRLQDVLREMEKERNKIL